MGKDGGPFTSNQILLRLTFWPFAIATVALPSLSLAICFLTAYFFRFDDVNGTMCEVILDSGGLLRSRVKNFIPSISAVTGITPQTYLWRLGIALHATPRLVVCFLHYNRYLQRVGQVEKSRQGLFRSLIRLNFWLSLVENMALIVVSFISNRENYPVHEKVFIVFMVTTLTYMLCNIICFKMSSNDPMTPDEARSYFWKKTLFTTTMTATVGLVYFYLRHRLLCEPGAFSYFSLCEYVIAYAAMYYHFTAYLEFKHNEWLVACPQKRVSVTDNNNTCQNQSPASSSRSADDATVRNRKF